MLNPILYIVNNEYNIIYASINRINENTNLNVMYFKKFFLHIHLVYNKRLALIGTMHGFGQKRVMRLLCQTKTNASFG